jgi:Na+/melibiose symporter-like transporter
VGNLPASEVRLPAGRLAAYAAPGVPLAALTLPVYIYLPAFYAEDLGLGLALVGGLLLAARLFDVVTDPIVGALSDRWQTRWGRRRPWLVAGLPLMLLAMFQLFLPPDGAGAAHLVGWTLALYLGWTIVLLPYAAWGAELSGDYNERSRIVGAREACIVAGTVLAAALPGALPLVLDDVSGDARAESLAAIAWFCLFALPLTVGTALLFVPEPAPAAVGRVALMPGLRLIAANAPFRRLLIAYLLNGTANGMTATLFLLFVSHVLQLPDQAGYLLLAYFVSGIVSVPIWVAVSYRLGKAPAWAVGLALTSLLFVAVPFLGPGDVWPFLAVCIATGLCLGADLALPGSMQADVVDLDTLQAGSQRTGLFFALWGMATKLALALAVGVAFPVLDLVGFDARAVTDDARLGLSLLYGAAPIAIKLSAIALLWRYPIDARRQAELRAALANRPASAS